jgi:heme exporter protein A
VDATVSTTTPTPLELHGIGRRFQHRWALRGASLRLERGEVLALMGQNGSGKSTLLRIAAMLLRPSKGGGAVFGHDIVRDRVAARGLVGLLAHDNGLYEDFTAAENLRFVLRMLGRPPEPSTIERALADVGLAGVADERVRDFSSGMQRRLAIARVKLHAPPLLLLDEPYNSVDTEGVTLINALIAESRERGGAVLVVVHDVERVGGVATRWARLVDGRVTTTEAPDAAVRESRMTVEEVA